MAPDLDLLGQAYKAFLNNRDEEQLFQAIQSYGGKKPSSLVDYPVCHRIRDLQLFDITYRVVRIFDPDDNATQLFIYPIESDFFSASEGVPYELQGEALARWVWDESNHPIKDEPDWSQYF